MKALIVAAVLLVDDGLTLTDFFISYVSLCRGVNIVTVPSRDSKGVYPPRDAGCTVEYCDGGTRSDHSQLCTELIEAVSR